MAEMKTPETRCNAGKSISVCYQCFKYLKIQKKIRNAKFKASAPSSSPFCVEAVHLIQQNTNQTQ